MLTLIYKRIINLVMRPRSLLVLGLILTSILSFVANAQIKPISTATPTAKPPPDLKQKEIKDPAETKKDSALKNPKKEISKDLKNKDKNSKKTPSSIKFGSLLGGSILYSTSSVITYNSITDFDIVWRKRLSGGVGYRFGRVTDNNFDRTTKINFNTGYSVFRFNILGLGLYSGAEIGYVMAKGDGSEHVDVTLNRVSNVFDVTYELVVKSLYVQPMLGWLEIWDNGFALGGDIGYRYYVNPKSTLKTTASTTAGTAAISTPKSLEIMDQIEEDYKKNYFNGSFILGLTCGWFF